MPYDIRALADVDGCNSLSLGDEGLVPLKTFLRREAKQFHRSDLAKTFVLVEIGHNRVLAYVTLVCTQIAATQFGSDVPVEGFRYPDYPAVKLARLAVDASLRGKGAGTLLVNFAVAVTKEFVMPHVGCRFMVVDSKPNSVGFYQRKGFVEVAPGDGGQIGYTTMFVDLQRLQGDDGDLQRG